MNPSAEMEQEYVDLLEKARKAKDENPTTKNINAFVAAEKALADYRARAAAEADPKSRTFSTLLEVLDYLQGEGWKISKSTLYDNQHKINKAKDGTYTKKAVDEYARLCLVKLDGSTDEGKGAAEKKEEIEAKIAEERLKKLQRDNEIEQGRWVRRSEVESMLAARAAALMNGVGPEFIHREAAGIIELVEGDIEKAPDLIEHWLKVVEELFDRYSRPVEFTVPGAEDEDFIEVDA